VQRMQDPEREPEDTAPEEASNRLQDLLASFSVLRQDGRALIDQIRLSLLEMRELRQQLQEHHNTAVRESGDGSGRGRLAYFQIQYGLTPRETEVAALLAQGRSNTAIATALQISSHTARHHTQRVLTKLGVHSRAEAGAKLRA
jgi:DNA-binding NarL/FixJ family response regulator